MKKSFSLLELILTITLIGILYSFFSPNIIHSKIDEVSNKLILYLKETRYQALIDNKFSNNDSLWFKKRWTLKFFRCREEVGGIYYVIFSDKNSSGHPSIEDSLKDSLTNKNIYSSNYCEEKKENTKYVLLTKSYNIQTVEISCNQTSSLGQISFGSDGNVYSKLSNNTNEEYEYQITDICTIKLKDNLNNTRIIKINAKTGQIEEE